MEPLLKDTTDPVAVVGHTPGLCHQSVAEGESLHTHFRGTRYTHSYLLRYAPLLKDTPDPAAVVGHTPGLCHQFYQSVTTLAEGESLHTHVGGH